MPDIIAHKANKNAVYAILCILLWMVSVGTAYRLYYQPAMLGIEKAHEEHEAFFRTQHETIEQQGADAYPEIHRIVQDISKKIDDIPLLNRSMAFKAFTQGFESAGTLLQDEVIDAILPHHETILVSLFDKQGNVLARNESGIQEFLSDARWNFGEIPEDDSIALQTIGGRLFVHAIQAVIIEQLSGNENMGRIDLIALSPVQPPDLPSASEVRKTIFMLAILLIPFFLLLFYILVKFLPRRRSTPTESIPIIAENPETDLRAEEPAINREETQAFPEPENPEESVPSAGSHETPSMVPETMEGSSGESDNPHPASLRDEDDDQTIYHPNESDSEDIRPVPSERTDELRIEHGEIDENTLPDQAGTNEPPRTEEYPDFPAIHSDTEVHDLRDETAVEEFDTPAPENVHAIPSHEENAISAEPEKETGEDSAEVSSEHPDEDPDAEVPREDSKRTTEEKEADPPVLSSENEIDPDATIFVPPPSDRVEDRSVSDSENSHPTSHTEDDDTKYNLISLKVGDLIDEHYEIVDIVGKGGAGIVCKARDPFLERNVAIKILNNAKLIKRFINEARVGVELQHENIVKVHLLRKDRNIGFHYLAMDFIEGCNLKRWLRENPEASYRQILHILGKVSAGLHYAHEKNTCHRDVKPENIMIGKVSDEQKEPSVYLVDFGLSKLKEGEGDLTRFGGVGTLKYMAPEQHRGQSNYKADIYSFGVIAFLMLSGGELPEEPGKTNISEVNPVLDSRLGDVLNKAMQYYPSERYDDISIFFGELDQAITASGLAMDRPVSLKPEAFDSEDPTE